MRSPVFALLTGGLLVGLLGLAGCQACVTDSSQPADTNLTPTPSPGGSGTRYRPRLGVPLHRMTLRDAGDDE